MDATCIFFNTIFVSSRMYPESPEETRVFVGSMNMGYDLYPTLPGIEPVAYLGEGYWAMAPFGKKFFFSAIGKNRKTWFGPPLCEV